MIRHSIFILFTCLLSAQLTAQPYIDILSLHYEGSPAEGLIRQNNQEVEFTRLGINASIPLKIGKHYLIFYPGYESQKIQHGSFDAQTIESAYLPITFAYQWKNQEWTTAFTSISRLNGNLSESNEWHEFAQQGGAILFINKKKKERILKFGAYVNDEFFGIFVLPLLGLDWQINDRWQIFGTLPREMFLNRSIGEKSNAGLLFRARTNSYRVLNDGSRGFYDIRENQLKLFANYRLPANIVLSAEAGHSIFRRASFDDASGSNFEDVNDGFVFRLGMSYRINTN